jgi:putative salt-induced outer membrane protein
MKYLGKWSTGVLLAMAISPAMAQSQQEEGLDGKVALGYLATSGNSESENMSLNFSGNYYGEVWHHALDGRSIRASTSGVTTAEAYGLSWQSARDFGEHSYMFGRVAWDQDKFSGYDQQIREVVGYGRHIVATDRHKLDGEVGVGARQSDLRDGTSEDETIARLSLDYSFQLSETAEFEQSLGVESGSQNTYTESVTAVSADVWTNLAIVLSYTVKNNSDVPVGIKKRDTFTAVSLEYSF